MSGRAVVLAGGGPKGAYELGAWMALRELDVQYDALYGTSIGAINAALMAQGDFDVAKVLWENITPAQVIGGLDPELTMVALPLKRKDIVPFLKRYVHHRGMDIAPFKEMVSRTIDEERVRAAGFKMGFVMVRYPSFRPLEISLSEIPPGQLVDYVMASSACFPAFPVYRIGDAGFIDGGYYDTLPINFALRDGAEEVVAIDLFDRPLHAHFRRKPFITYIKPSWPLGGYLQLDQSELKRSARLGYLDVLKVYGRLDGLKYALTPAQTPREELREAWFALELSRLEARVAYRSNVALGLTGTPLSTALNEALDGGAPTRHNMYVAGRETCARLFGLDPLEIHTHEGFHAVLREKLDALTDTALDTPGAIEAILRRIAGAKDSERAQLMVQVYARLHRDGRLDDRWVRDVHRMPAEVIAAYYLRAALDA